MRSGLCDVDPGGSATSTRSGAKHHCAIHRQAICKADVSQRDGLEEQPTVVYLAYFRGSKCVGGENKIHNVSIAHSLERREKGVVEFQRAFDVGKE